MGKKVWTDVTRKNHCVYRLDYHMVFVVEYRKKCITAAMGSDMVAEVAKLAELKGGSLVEGKSDVAHLHLLVSLPPNLNLANFIGTLKNATSKLVRRKYGDEIRKYLTGDVFWSPSYYVSTTGGANLDTIKQYIEKQGIKRQKRIVTGEIIE